MKLYTPVEIMVADNQRKKLRAQIDRKYLPVKIFVKGLALLQTFSWLETFVSCCLVRLGNILTNSSCWYVTQTRQQEVKIRSQWKQTAYPLWILQRGDSEMDSGMMVYDWVWKWKVGQKGRRDSQSSENSMLEVPYYQSLEATCCHVWHSINIFTNHSCCDW